MRWTILQECFQSFETLRFLCNLFSKSLIHDFLLNRTQCAYFSEFQRLEHSLYAFVTQ